MVGASDRTTVKMNPDGNDWDRSMTDEMEDYGEWLKSDTEATKDFARLSNEEENLLGSFSDSFSFSEDTSTGSGASMAPESMAQVSDIFHDEDEDVLSDTFIESQIEAEEAIDSNPLSITHEDFDDTPALSDDFVLGSLASGTRTRDGGGVSARHAAEASGAASHVAEVSGAASHDADEADDEISEEFFEIDEEVRTQAESPLREVQLAPDSTSVPGTPAAAREVATQTSPILGKSRENPGLASPEITVSTSGELADATLARIVQELSSIRSELINIKAGFPHTPLSEEMPLEGNGAVADAVPGKEAADPVAPLSPECEPDRQNLDRKEYRADDGEPSKDAEKVAVSEASGASHPADSRFSKEFVGELREMFSYLDRLLESLPDATIEEFARSPYFDSYKRIFETLEIV